MRTLPTSSMLGNLISQPGHLIRRAHQLAWAAFMDEAGEDDITPVQYAILVAVTEFPGIDATRLSQLVAFDRATIGNVLGRLEGKGLLKRAKSKGDKRAKTTFLTPEGKLAIKKIDRRVDRIAERIFGTFTAKERRTLITLLSKLVSIDQVSAAIKVASEHTASN